MGVFQVMNNFQVNFCPDGIQQWLITGITTQLLRFSTPTTSNALALQPYASVSPRPSDSRLENYMYSPLLLEVLRSRETKQFFLVADTSLSPTFHQWSDSLIQKVVEYIVQQVSMTFNLVWTCTTFISNDLHYRGWSPSYMICLCGYLPIEF